MATSKKLECTAYHEAGHAVAAYRQHLRFRYVTIKPDENDDSLGHLLHRAFDKRFRPDIALTPKMVESIEKHIVNCFAGPIAEKKFTGRWNHTGASSDNAAAANLASYVHGHPKVIEAYLAYLHEAAAALVELDQNWQAITAVAVALPERSTLKRSEVIEAIEQAWGLPPLPSRQ